jgi:transposase-like protein
LSNAALAADRKARAVELALTGASYDQIAGELGYANRGTVWRAVQSGLKARRFAAVDDYREAELHRLDRLERRLVRRLDARIGSSPIHTTLRPFRVGDHQRRGPGMAGRGARAPIPVD